MAVSNYSITFIFIIRNIHFYLLYRYKSRTTIAAMLSTTGTALLTTQGSWRPWASKIVFSPLKLQVSYSNPIVETGLNATLKYIFSPLVIPPKVPPALFVIGFKFLNLSLWILPFSFVPSNPDPNSNPFVAGILIIAWAKTAWNLSKHGSPNPIGHPLITQVTVPPIESFSSFTYSIIFIISKAES